MADNSKYTAGFDLYEGNDILSWPAARGYFRFLYVRAAIGSQFDSKFAEFVKTAKAAGFLVGAYIEQWPGTPIDWQVSTLQQAITNSGVTMDLPAAIAYEKQSVWNAKLKKYVPTFPGAGEFDALYKALSAVMPTVGYTGLDGLNQLKNYGLTLNNYEWWIARYYFLQGMMGEMSVDDTLTYLNTNYSITKDRVLFMQTADAIGYPSPTISNDKGCDYDRAISFVIDGTPTPQPPPNPAFKDVEITVVSATPVQLASVLVDGTDATDSAHLTVVPPAAPEPNPEPAPAPVPASKANRYRILHDFEMPAKYWGGHSRTAGEHWTGNAITPETCRINGTVSGVKLTDAEVKAVTAINAPYPKALNYISAHQGGWVNYSYWPNVEQLTFGGNFVDVLSVDTARNRAYIRVWHGEDGSGVDDDCVIHHWTNIGNQNQIYTGSWKGPAFIILAYDDGVWIELDKLVKV